MEHSAIDHMLKPYIKRSAYLKKIEPYLGKDIIKVFTGQRRVGKSYMLFQVMDMIKKRDSDANIIYINKELHAFRHIQAYENLLSHVAERAVPGKKTYLFIDEVQEISAFEKPFAAFTRKEDAISIAREATRICCPENWRRSSAEGALRSRSSVCPILNSCNFMV